MCVYFVGTRIKIGDLTEKIGDGGLLSNYIYGGKAS